MDCRSCEAGPAPSGAPGLPPTERRLLLRSLGRWIERCLFLGGVVTLAACAAVLLEAALYQGFHNRRLEQADRQARSATESAGSGAHRMVGRLEIPRLGLSAVIREGIDRHTLLIAVGHVPGTSLPGEDGNIVVSGHRDTFFRRLRNVTANDAVRIVTRDGVFHYRVDWTRVTTPDRTEVLDPTDTPTLTLITCYPFNFIGPAPKRFIVRAQQIPQPTG